MTTETRWTLLSVPRGGAAFASGLRRDGPADKRRKAELCEWESEGGTPASPIETRSKIPG